MHASPLLAYIRPAYPTGTSRANPVLINSVLFILQIDKECGKNIAKKQLRNLYQIGNLPPGGRAKITEFDS